MPNKIKTVKIVSNNICLGPEPTEGDEIEQHLTIRSDGRYWLSRYEYGSGLGKHRLWQKSQGRLMAGKASSIFALFNDFCESNVLLPMLMDCGTWELKVSFGDGTTKSFNGSLGDDYSDLSKVSQMIRTELDLYDLFLFDGQTSSPQYELGAIPIFEKYLPLLYENTFLWSRFSELCHSFFNRENRRDDFFAYQRDPACIDTWLALLDNMGGGIPIFFFSAAAFIILAYKNAGNDIDAELAKIATPSIPDEDNI